jgi:hypothetical protein
MTPEQIEAERVEHERAEREYVERMRREVDIQFHDAYRTYTTYTTTGVPLYSINVDTFFSPPAMRSAPPPPSTLTERYNAALQEANRCAQRGDPHGQLQATNTARRLRTEIARLTSTTII